MKTLKDLENLLNQQGVPTTATVRTSTGTEVLRPVPFLQLRPSGDAVWVELCGSVGGPIRPLEACSVPLAAAIDAVRGQEWHLYGPTEKAKAAFQHLCSAPGASEIPV